MDTGCHRGSDCGRIPESETEEWRPVVGFEGMYEVSSFGRVKSLNRMVPNPGNGIRNHPVSGRIIAPWKKSKYPTVHLSRDGVITFTYVHHLVAEAFLGPRQANMQVAHNDGVPRNCSVWNLRYDTQSGNEADKLRHGTHNRGDKSHYAKLTWDQVSEIRMMAKSGVYQTKIGAMFGVRNTTVWHIVHNKSWKEINQL